MKKYHPLILKFSAVILGGAFFSFLQLTQTQSVLDAVLIGFFYALMLYLVISIIQKFVTSKLSAFSAGQQWLLKTLIYTIAISFCYLAGLVFQIIIVNPIESIQDIITDKIWQGAVALVSSPFRLGVPDDLFSAEFRGLIIIFFALFFLIAIVSIVASFIEMHWQEVKQKQAIERAELTALRAQIEPHFLFNSLNTIVSIIKSDAQKAEDLLIQLSDILHYMFQNSGKAFIELEAEVLFSSNYINLMQARYGSNLVVNWHQNTKRTDQKVPVFLIQPVIENSIRHAWQNKKKKLIIDLKITEYEDQTTVTIKDNGIGIHPEALKKLPNPQHALGNISERLNLLFMGKDLLHISSIPGKGTSIKIKIPKGSHD
jgi:signal transduction histidine kinase